MNTSTLTLPARPIRRIKGDPYLQFQLATTTIAGLSMRQIQEVRILPVHRLTPIPNMPSYVLGLMNQRSRVRWVIDLAQLMGLPGLQPSLRQYELMLIRIGTISLGLAVQKIETAIWVDPNSIQSVPNYVEPALLPYLQGCMLQSQTVLLILDMETIAQSAMAVSDKNG
jgi:positive phototaxis protein PixI